MTLDYKEWLMECPHCNALNSRQLKHKTDLGYLQYYCRDCKRQYNERTGTALNHIQYPTEVVMLVVFYYYRFNVSLDDVVELMGLRGFNICHQTVHNWVHTFGVNLGIKIRSKRRGKSGKKWHTDATYIKVEGRWCYLYRAIDKESNLVDVYLSDVRDQKAAEDFFLQAAKTSGVEPLQITTDKEPALYPAIKNVFGNDVKHRDSKYKNNCIEQDHRGTKSRLFKMKGFKNIFCALRFCTVFDEVRNLFKMKDKTRAERRSLFAPKFQEFSNIVLNAA